jgi:2,3-bisphosphoglycerate-dependent phosphoglycerate mutase
LPLARAKCFPRQYDNQRVVEQIAEATGIGLELMRITLRNLYVVTHPESRHHVEGLVGGWYDSELTEHGMSQALTIGLRLKELLPENAKAEIYTSDLIRTRQTAETIAKFIQVPVRSTDGLRERSYGEAGGKPQRWLDERFVHAPRDGNRLDHEIGIRGAETIRAFAARIYRSMEAILVSPCTHQIIVTHGWALTFVIASWIKMPLDSVGYIHVKHTGGGISHLFEDDLFHSRGIQGLNDTSHLSRAS